MYDQGVRGLRYFVVTMLVAALLAWAGAVGFLWANEARFVYRADQSRSVGAFDGPFQAGTLQSDGLSLDAVSLEHGAGGDGDRYWMIYLNGAAGSIHRSRYREQLHQLHSLGYNVFSFDYRGFGRNEGTPTEEGLYADALAAYRHLTLDRQVLPARIILTGRSLGSAVAVELATRAPVAGLVLLSPIDSVPRVGARLYPWAPVSLLAVNRFDSLSKVGGIKAPIVVVHATADRFVPIAAGRALYEAATAPKLMVESNGGHNSAGFSPVSELADALARFWPTPEIAGAFAD